MAIIKPSLKFAGSELNLNNTAVPYIKEGVQRALFNKSNNPDGAYLYFLPAYKSDEDGNGVWYKKVSVRDNFGTSFKEKYFVPSRAADPAEYFYNNLRIIYPEDAQIRDVENNGKKFKQYPFCGRITDRVLYNVAFAQHLELGAHVLDLPLRNGADILMNWLDGKDLSGRQRLPINDPDRCLPVFVKLKENSANPWMLQVDTSEPVALPEQLADSDYLYNLDDVLISKSKEEIIAKLREMYSSEVFEDCMNGYPGLTRSSSPTPVAAPKSEPVVASRPVMNIPKPTMNIPKPAMNAARPAAAAVQKAEVPKVNIPTAIPEKDAYDIGSLPPNPMKLSREEALKFINEA
jgi:hypothetical protein